MMSYNVHKKTLEHWIYIEALCAAPPEAYAHSPSQMPLSCPVAPPSQRELHKDRAAVVVAWRGGRAPPGPGSPSPAPRPGTSSTTPCAASFTCSSFMCHLSAGVGGGARVRVAARRSIPFLSAASLFWPPPLENGACHDENLHAPILRGAWVPPHEDDACHDEHNGGGGGGGGGDQPCAWRRRWW